MAIIDLGKLLKSDILRITVSDSPGGLAEPLGTSCVPELELEVQPGTGELDLVQGRVALSARGVGKLGARFLTADESLDPFGTGEPWEAPSGLRRGVVALEARLETSASGTLPTPAPWTLSARAAALGGFEYGHVLPVEPSEKVHSAIVRLLAGTRPATAVPLAELLPGEAHWMVARLGLDFDVEGSFGKDYSISLVHTLFDDLPVRFEGHVEMCLKAALGLALHDDLRITVGLPARTEGGRVRVRVSRAKERSLTLGASLSLEATYDVGSGLTTLLNHILGLAPVERAFSALRAVRDANELVAEGKWEELEEKLGREACETLDELLAETGWREWLATDPRVARLVAFCDRAVTEYDALDDRLRGWWEDALATVGLGGGSKVRAILDQVAGLKPKGGSYLAALLDLVAPGQRQQEVVELVELVTGESLEELLLANAPSAEDLVAEAVRKVANAARFLANADDDLSGRLHRFARSAGVEGVVDWLRDNATSVEKLQSAMSKRFRTVVCRLLDRAWEEGITEEDCRRLQRLAAKLRSALAEPDQWVARLKGDLDKLKGNLGLSVSAELARVWRSSALVDLEVAPSAPEVAEVERALRRGDVRGLLDVLASWEPEDEDLDTLPWVLRECLFTSEKLRTSVAQQVLAFTGLTRLSRREVLTSSESRLRVTHDAAAGTLRRDAHHVGTFTRTETRDGVFQASATLAISAQGPGGKTDEPYATVTPEIRLSVLVDEPKIQPEEIRGLATLLEELGLTADASPFVAPIPVGARVRCAASLTLPPASTEALLRPPPGAAEWFSDVHQAACRWFDEPLVTAKEAGLFGHRLGLVLATLARDPKVAAILRDANRSEGDLALHLANGGKGVRLKVGSKSFAVVPITQSSQWKPPYAGLGQVMYARNRGRRRLRKAVDLFHAGTTNPEALGRCVWQFAEALRTGCPRSWASPLYTIWFLKQRLTTLGKPLVQSGYASLRWELGTARGGPELLVHQG